MNTFKIDRVLKKFKFTRTQFCGVMPIDLLPLKKVRRPCSFIINTDKSTLPGMHWFAIYLPKTGHIEYFDSFGLKPMNKECYKFFKLNGKWKYNNLKLQSNTSKSCGKFCAIFLAYRSKGLSYSDFLSLFNENTKSNEMLINLLFKKLYSK